MEEVSAGFDADGKLVAWKLHITSPSITSRFDPTIKDPFDSVIEYAHNYPYDVPNFALTYSRQEIGIDVGYMRSVSHAPNCFVIESFMDELAAAASKNPLDFRLSLLARKPRHARVLKFAAERAGWGQRPEGRYLGLAFMEGYTTHIAQVAEISVDRRRAQGAQDHLRRRLRPDGQSAHRRIADRKRHRLRADGGAVGRHHAHGGRVQQTNFNNYRVLRINEMPELDVHLVESERPAASANRRCRWWRRRSAMRFSRQRASACALADCRPRAYSS